MRSNKRNIFKVCVLVVCHYFPKNQIKSSQNTLRSNRISIQSKFSVRIESRFLLFLLFLVVAIFFATEQIVYAIVFVKFVKTCKNSIERPYFFCFSLKTHLLRSHRLQLITKSRQQQYEMRKQKENKRANRLKAIRSQEICQYMQIFMFCLYEVKFKSSISFGFAFVLFCSVLFRSVPFIIIIIICLLILQFAVAVFFAYTYIVCLPSHNESLMMI